MNSTESGRSSDSFVRKVELSFDRAQIEGLQTEVARELSARSFDDGAAFAVRLAIEEAIVNGFRHGNAGDPTKTVQFECEINQDMIRVDVVDQGPGFNPEGVPDPTDEANLEVPSGRGIMLMRAYMTEVDYLPPGNRVRMVYERTASS
ncbi:MAG: ATP-binding protein [Phycisphaerales bacterium]|jgi:serine/threonine-protein kinase RsbW|nr:ATP-binding protein [Phycisphaerales bacterium]